MNTEPNDSVTPREVEVDLPGGYGTTTMTSGLTKREYFAAMAFQGLLTNPESNSTLDNILAKAAVKAADELINALNAQP